jgi:hypothetical protein
MPLEPHGEKWNQPVTFWLRHRAQSAILPRWARQVQTSTGATPTCGGPPSRRSIASSNMLSLSYGTSCHTRGEPNLRRRTHIQGMILTAYFSGSASPSTRPRHKRDGKLAACRRPADSSQNSTLPNMGRFTTKEPARAMGITPYGADRGISWISYNRSHRSSRQGQRDDIRTVGPRRRKHDRRLRD